MSGWKLARLLDGLGDGAGLGDDLEARPPVEQRDEALADDLVVVDDEQAQRSLDAAGGVRAASVTVGLLRAGRGCGR